MAKIRDIVKILSKKYEINEWWKQHDAFITFVSIILSQRTYWKNVRTATEQFADRFKTIEEVAKANVKEIERTIRPAGLYHARAPRIKEVAENLVEKYGGSLDGILKLPYVEAKKELISIKGIGPKTADVFLMALKGEQVLPVDVHIARIMRRLGVANKKDDYERLRTKIESEVPPKDRTRAHLVLIEFGRRVCKMQNPKCEECPVSKYCFKKIAHSE